LVEVVKETYSKGCKHWYSNQ